MNAKRLSLFTLVLIVLAGLPLGRALAKEIVGVSISGPGLPGEVELTDANARQTASAPWFDLIATGEPTDLPEGGYYEIRMAIGEGVQVVATNVFHYYPGSPEQAGYFYYAECIGCTSSATGDWYRLREREDLALRQLLVGLGAPSALMGAPEKSASRPAGANPPVPAGNPVQEPAAAASPVKDAAPRQANLPIIAVLSLAALALAGFGLLRRRSLSPTR